MVQLSNGDQKSVKDILMDKHPRATPSSPETLIEGTPPTVHPVRYEAITADLVKSISLRSRGAAGPSGVDAGSWKKMCSSFKDASVHLCRATARLARHLAESCVNPEKFEPLLASRLIALDKQPGVRPIGVGEILRRVTSKAILQVAKPDIEEACGFVQKCSGMPAGIEAAVHAMQEIYMDESTEGILLVDATNAFNSMNRSAALHNVKFTCPVLATFLHNAYQHPSRLIIDGGGEITSEEGTTQGDPLSMAFYALSTVPLISTLQTEHPDVRQIWYADDSGGGGRLRQLRSWWDTINGTGQSFGYDVNRPKTILLVKPDVVEVAQELFIDTAVRITTDGAPYLGSAVGEHAFREAFLRTKVDLWCKELECLAEFAQSEPQAAYAALTHGLRGRWNYLLRTMDGTEEAVEPLDRSIRHVLLPQLTGQGAVPEEDIPLLYLPARLGGIGLPCLALVAAEEHKTSVEITRAQVDEILWQNDQARQPPQCVSVHNDALATRAEIRTARRKSQNDRQMVLRSSAPARSRQVELLAGKGCSAWLTALPLREHGFALSKQEFRDALAFRYGWEIPGTPEKCVCGTSFSTNHAMVCSHGGFPTVRHNELRNLFGELLTELCHDVRVEPCLQSLSGEVFSCRSANTAPDARADVRARGFWTPGEDAFFDVRVFHPNAPSYVDCSPASLFSRHERCKRREYQERIVNIERKSFTPVVLATTGACGPAADCFIKRLAGQLAEHDRQPYSTVVAWLRIRIAFALVRSAILCLRGGRSARHRPVFESREVAIAEARIYGDE